MLFLRSCTDRPAIVRVYNFETRRSDWRNPNMRLLQDGRSGERRPLDELTPLVYREPRQSAVAQRAACRSHTRSSPPHSSMPASAALGTGAAATKQHFRRMPPAVQPRYLDLIRMNEILSRLAARGHRQSQIVERFFAALSEEKIADVLSVSVRTLRRESPITRAGAPSAVQRDSDDTDGRSS